MNLYVKCPNIEASMYTQVKLRDVFGFQILKQNNDPHFTDRFVVVTPPEHCIYAQQLLEKNNYYFVDKHMEKCKECGKYKDDKPVICSYQTTMDRDGTLAPLDDKNWIDMLDAIKLISMVTPKI